MADLEWTCHVCGRLRPDARISVHTRNVTLGPVEFQENVRFCNDRQTCINSAPTTYLTKASANAL